MSAHTEAELRDALKRIHHYAIGESDRAYMSIPADPRHDADLVLSAAIDELVELRAKVVPAVDATLDVTAELARVTAELATLKSGVEQLSNPLAVRVNIYRGTIAKPWPEPHEVWAQAADRAEENEAEIERLKAIIADQSRDEQGRVSMPLAAHNKIDAARRERDEALARAEAAEEQLKTRDQLVTAELARVTAERDELANELERERMRLAACGVVAMSNTKETAARNREMHADYLSASLGDVIRIVDSEMAQRARAEAAEKERDELLARFAVDIETAVDATLDVTAELARVTAERDELAAETSNLSRLVARQADLLTAAVNALKGEPPELILWSHHDVGELAAAMTAERDALKAGFARLCARLKLDSEHWEHDHIDDGPEPDDECRACDYVALLRDSLRVLGGEPVHLSPTEARAEAAEEQLKTRDRLLATTATKLSEAYAANAALRAAVKWVLTHVEVVARTGRVAEGSEQNGNWQCFEWARDKIKLALGLIAEATK